LKIYGLIDPNRSKGELSLVLEKMKASMNHGSYSSDVLVKENLGMGRSFIDFARTETQPVHAKDKSKFVFMVGKISGYEEKKEELVRKGYVFRYPKSDAEFVLHGFEEWGRDLIRELNGEFALAIYDAASQKLIIANGRCGMEPLYYYFDEQLFIFASEVKAIIQDERVEKEINWDGWHDIFSYGRIYGNKTLFLNIHRLDDASILTLNKNAISIEKYWRYDQIKVNHEGSEQYFVDESVRLIKQAIERQVRDIDDCIVSLSGGYDSRGIALALSMFTDMDYETYTLFTCEEDVVFAREVADCLKVKNVYVPRPRDLIKKRLVEKVYLLDGMRVLLPPPPTTLMTLHHMRSSSDINKVIFNGLGGDVLFTGSRHNIPSDITDEKLALFFDRRRRRRTKVDEFFHSPIREKLRPKIDSLLEEVKVLGKQDNRMSIFQMREARNVFSRLSINITSVRSPVYFMYLDKDLVEFGFSIPQSFKKSKNLSMKFFQKIFPRENRRPRKEIWFKILKKISNRCMRIPSTNDIIFPTLFLKSFILSRRQKKELLLLLIKNLKHFLTRLQIRSQVETHSKQTLAEIGYMINLMKKLDIPDFINIKGLMAKTQEYLKNDKNPIGFFVPILEFCIWYNLFITNVPLNQLIDGRKKG